jgi:hypothetical protein
VRLRPIQGLRDCAVSAAKLTRPASQRSLALFSNFDFAHPQQPFAPAACIGGARAVAHEQSTKQSPGGVSALPCSSRTCTCRTTCTRLWASSQSSRARTRGRSAWRTAEPLRSLHRLRGRRRESLARTARITTRRNAITMTRMLPWSRWCGAASGAPQGADKEAAFQDGRVHNRRRPEGEGSAARKATGTHHPEVRPDSGSCRHASFAG